MSNKVKAPRLSMDFWYQLQFCFNAFWKKYQPASRGSESSVFRVVSIDLDPAASHVLHRKTWLWIVRDYMVMGGDTENLTLNHPAWPGLVGSCVKPTERRILTKTTTREPIYTYLQVILPAWENGRLSSWAGSQLRYRPLFDSMQL
jgi:hypothetical protein